MLTPSKTGLGVRFSLMQRDCLFLTSHDAFDLSLKTDVSFPGITAGGSGQQGVREQRDLSDLIP